MSTLALWLVLFAALVQLAFAVLEMAFWRKIVGPRVGGFDPVTTEKTAALGLNMGLYNGLLAAGLIWSLFARPDFGVHLALYLTIFMLIAGIVGGLSVKRTIGLAQGGPALAALLALLASR